MKTINQNICAAVALLNRSNWFNITVETPEKEESRFCATGINLTCKGKVIELCRQFSTPVYTGEVVDIVAINENKFSIMTDKGTLYTVEGQHIDTLADRQTANGNTDDLTTLIDWTRSRINDNGNIVVVLDLNKLGVISSVQHSKIKNYMNRFLGGLSQSKQKCRTIFFEDDNNVINIGLYDLESEQPMTSRLYDSGEYYFNNANKAKKDKVRRLMAYVLEHSEDVDADEE